MDIQQFAENHSLKVTRDSCGASIEQGKYSHIFDGYADGRLGVLFVAPTKRHRNNARKSWKPRDSSRSRMALHSNPLGSVLETPTFLCRQSSFCAEKVHPVGFGLLKSYPPWNKNTPLFIWRTPDGQRRGVRCDEVRTRCRFGNSGRICA